MLYEVITNWWNECLHGVARAGYATVFPQSITIAGSWDSDLIYRVAVITSYSIHYTKLYDLQLKTSAFLLKTSGAFHSVLKFPVFLLTVLVLQFLRVRLRYQ